MRIVIGALAVALLAGCSTSGLEQDKPVFSSQSKKHRNSLLGVLRLSGKSSTRQPAPLRLRLGTRLLLQPLSLALLHWRLLNR